MTRHYPRSLNEHLEWDGRLINPTGGSIRMDSLGAGYFNSKRGSRRHRG